MVTTYLDKELEPETYELTYYTKSKIVIVDNKENDYKVIISYDCYTSIDTEDNIANHVESIQASNESIVKETVTILPRGLSVPYLFADIIFTVGTSTYYIVRQDSYEG